MSAPAWTRLGTFDPRALTGARGACHHAVQLLTRVARGYQPEQPDDSHTSLAWSFDLAAWTGRLVRTGAPPFSLALRPAGLTLLTLNAAGMPDAELPLDGMTLTAAAAWVEARLAARGLPPEPFHRPLHFEIPPHPVADGSPFDLTDPLPFLELSRYYTDAALLIAAAAQREPGASPVRCWPHHFDIATLIPAGPSATIGYGLSPGDTSYAQPYFYVSPWPYPDAARLPELPAPAAWHTQGWTGAVLPAEALAALPSGDAQHRLAEDFGNRAVALLRRIRLTPAS